MSSRNDRPKRTGSRLIATRAGPGQPLVFVDGYDGPRDLWRVSETGRGRVATPSAPPRSAPERVASVTEAEGGQEIRPHGDPGEKDGRSGSEAVGGSPTVTDPGKARELVDDGTLKAPAPEDLDGASSDKKFPVNSTTQRAELTFSSCDEEEAVQGKAGQVRNGRDHDADISEPSVYAERLDSDTVTSDTSSGRSDRSSDDDFAVDDKVREEIESTVPDRANPRRSARKGITRSYLYTFTDADYERQVESASSSKKRRKD